MCVICKHMCVVCMVCVCIFVHVFYICYMCGMCVHVFCLLCVHMCVICVCDMSHMWGMCACVCWALSKQAGGWWGKVDQFSHQNDKNVDFWVAGFRPIFLSPLYFSTFSQGIYMTYIKRIKKKLRNSLYPIIIHLGSLSPSQAWGVSGRAFTDCFQKLSCPQEPSGNTDPTLFCHPGLAQMAW